MMDLPELIVLDVGHGSCAILRDTEAVTIIDCPPDITLIETLESLGIKTIDHVLISHSDVDHAGGLPNLLKRLDVRNVYLNPDAEKKGTGRGNVWTGVRIALDLYEELGTRVHTSLTTSHSKMIASGQVEIEILAPSSAVALGGSGGEDLQGRRLTSNSMSAVIGLLHKNHRVILLTGDIDEVGLDNLLKKRKDIESDILIFPHHGGSPGSSNGEKFAQQLCTLVKPRLVIFSLDRERFENPREDIMQGVISAVPDAHIMCTQLSRKCAFAPPRTAFSHLSNLPARGRRSNSCCGGSILVKIDGKETTYIPLFSQHRQFVSDSMNVALPLCLSVLAGTKI